MSTNTRATYTIATVTEHARTSHPTSETISDITGKSFVVVFISLVQINFGPSVVLERKDFRNFFFILEKRNGVDDDDDDDGCGTAGALPGVSGLFKSKRWKQFSYQYCKTVLKEMIYRKFLLTVP